jgi:hypothetical protein
VRSDKAKLAAFVILVLTGLYLALANGIEPGIGKCEGRVSPLVCAPVRP